MGSKVEALALNTQHEVLGSLCPCSRCHLPAGDLPQRCRGSRRAPPLRRPLWPQPPGGVVNNPGVLAYVGLVAHPNGAVVPAEPYEVVAARAAHLQALAEAA